MLAQLSCSTARIIGLKMSISQPSPTSKQHHACEPPHDDSAEWHSQVASRHLQDNRLAYADA